MEKIPTVKEILKETDLYSHIDDGGDKVFYSGFVELLMIEFAKLHVEAALNSVEKSITVNFSPSGLSKVAKDSILKSYPLENIQ